MSSLCTCFKSLKEINDLFFKFLWDRISDKTKGPQMIGDYGDGGPNRKLLGISIFHSG